MPLKTKTKTKQKYQKIKKMPTDEKILEAAKHLFLTRGIDRTTVRDIALEADINVALLNYYFNSKEQLFNYIFESLLEENAKSLNGILNDEIEIKEKVTAYVNEYFEILLSNPYLAFFMISVLNREPEKVVKSGLFKYLYNTDIFINQLISEAKKGKIKPVDPRHFFLNMISMVTMPFTVQHVLKDLYNLDKKSEFVRFMTNRKNLIIEMLLNDLKK